MGQTMSEQIFDGDFRVRHSSRSSSGSDKLKKVAKGKRNSCPTHNHMNYAVNPLASSRSRSATVSNAVPPVFPKTCSVYDKNFRGGVYPNKNEDEVIQKAVSKVIEPENDKLHRKSGQTPTIDAQSSFEDYPQSSASSASDEYSNDSGRCSLNGDDEHSSNTHRRRSAPGINFQRTDNLAETVNFATVAESEESDMDSQSSPTQTYVRRFAKMEEKIRNERKMEALKKKRARSPFRVGLQRLRSLSLSSPSESRNKSEDFDDLVSVGEICRRLSLDNQIFASDLPIPSGAKESQILEEFMIRQILDILPPRAEGYPWIKIYSSEKHGFSLATMYRKMAEWNEDMSPVLLIIKDTAGHIFGAVCSTVIKPKDHYYGTGASSLLWRFEGQYPEIKRLVDYKWSGTNQFFTSASKECLSFGAGGGHFGLWLDADLNHGRTQQCQTFDNDPLTGGDGDFIIHFVEAFGFCM